MRVKILFRLVMVTYAVVLQSTRSYCTIETLRPSSRGKIQPLFLNMTYHEETRITTYYGRFAGPSDLVTDSVGTLLKVSDGMDSSEFEIIAEFSVDDNYRRFILRSESASETLKIVLNRHSENNVQTTFGGTKCVFEVKRSRENYIEEYSSRLKSSGLDADYNIYEYFGGDINKDGNVESLTDLSESQIKDIGRYLNITHNYAPSHQLSSIIINKLAMLKDNVQFRSLYFDVFAVGFKPQGRHDIAEGVMWRYTII